MNAPRWRGSSCCSQAATVALGSGPYWFDPGVPVLTPPLTSSTDATRLREIGMVVYGFEPFRLSEEDDRSHGDDERLSLDNLRLGLEVSSASWRRRNSTFS